MIYTTRGLSIIDRLLTPLDSDSEEFDLLPYSMFAVRQTSCSEDFLRYLYEHHKWIINRVPDKYIAQYMGISNSWYCKLKKRLFY